MLRNVSKVLKSPLRYSLNIRKSPFDISCKKKKHHTNYGIMLRSYLIVANRIITTARIAISPVIPASRASKNMRDSMSLTSFPIGLVVYSCIPLFVLVFWFQD